MGWLLTMIAVLLLYTLSLGHMADFILKPMEGQYPHLKNEKLALDADVVPGGGSLDLDWINAAPMPDAETLSCLGTGVELAKRLRVPLILCGGNGEPFAIKVNDADSMAPSAYVMGMPKEQVIIENFPRETLENSYAVRKLVKGNRIVLATSASYMKRTKALFTRRGFTVIPAPTFSLAQTRAVSFNSFIPRASDLYRSSVGLAEWFNMAWWHVRGEM
ncbi:MAG TPA: YdcF family protein [Nitrospirota bacterium]|nr:YdcF family protein [Nitrospirota bacterium]